MNALITDGLFACMAAIGFGSISNTPRSLLPSCGIIAAIGHATRLALMSSFHLNIIFAGFAGSVCIGIASLLASRHYRCPYEVLAFPALLPMIPGMYAYRTIEALLLCLYHTREEVFSHYFYLFAFNGLTCTFIILGMVIGATTPVFLQKKLSFTATR